MTPYDAYVEYLALKKHFSDDGYDYFKYNGKVRTSPAAFERRTDRFFFEKLAKHSDVRGFLVSCLVRNPKAWIKDIVHGADVQKNYTEWLKRQQSLTYMFKSDLEHLDQDFKVSFACPPQGHPLVLKKYITNEICLDTLCILLDVTGGRSYWEFMMLDDLIWQEVSGRVDKYVPFIDYDRAKMKQIYLKHFEVEQP